MNTFRPKYFKLEELVDPGILYERGERAWELLQMPALVTLDQLRAKFGPIVVNGTLGEKTFSESGLRRWTGAGVKWSMHKFGGAFDPKFLKVPPQEAFDYILQHPEEFPFLTTMEDVKATVTWLHFDVRNHGRAGIWIVNP